MRTLDELGISPAPWRVGVGDKSQLIYDRNDAYFAFLYSALDIAANARLIAAAPKMYKTLCDEYNFLELLYEEMPNEPIERRMLAIEDALAAASGESEVASKRWNQKGEKRSK